MTIDRSWSWLISRNAVPVGHEKWSPLRNTINAVFQNKLSDEELSWLMASLESLGYITVDGTKVTYALPQADS